MRAPLSIVIPTFDAAGDLPGCLASLIEGLEAGIIREVVVSDGGSSDATCDIARAAGADVVSGSVGRGAQLRRGAAAASGEWLLFLHADTWLAPGWSGAVATHFATAERAAVFRLRFRARGLAPRIVAGWANLRTHVLDLPYGDQGLLVARKLHDAVGGFAEIPLMEDVAMARALRGRITTLEVVAETSAARYVAEGWLRRSARNGLLMMRYLSGADPAALALAYGKGN